MRKSILITVLLCICHAVQAKEPIAVMDLKPKGVPPATASILSDELRTVLFKAGDYNVLNREDMKAILGEHAFQQSGACDDTKCMAKVGGALGVIYIVTGSIGKLGNTYSITLKMIDIEKIENVNIVDEKYQGAEDGLFTAVSNAGLKLLGKKTAAAPAVEPVVSEPEPAPATNVDRLELYQGFWSWQVTRDGIKLGPPFGAFGTNGRVKDILNREPTARPYTKKVDNISCSYFLLEMVALAGLIAAPTLVEDGNKEAGIGLLGLGTVLSLVNIGQLKSRTKAFTMALDLYNGGGKPDRQRVTYNDVKVLLRKVTVIGTRKQVKGALYVYEDRMVVSTGGRSRMLPFGDITNRTREGAVTYYSFGDEKIGFKGLDGKRAVIDRLIKKYKSSAR